MIVPEPTIFGIMTVSDLVLIIAIVLGPILAVQVDKIIEHVREARQRRVQLFRTLMATRGTGLSPFHVEALNLIDVEFYGERKYEGVRRAWREYRDHLNRFPQPTDPSTSNPRSESTDPRFTVWITEKDRLLTTLLSSIGKALNFDFDELTIKNGVYVPVGHEKIETEQTLVRQGLINVLFRQSPLSMTVESFPATITSEEADEQQRLRQAALRFLEQNQPITVRLTDQDDGKTSA